MDHSRSVAALRQTEVLASVIFVVFVFLLFFFCFVFMKEESKYLGRYFYHGDCLSHFLVDYGHAQCPSNKYPRVNVTQGIPLWDKYLGLNSCQMKNVNDAPDLRFRRFDFLLANLIILRHLLIFARSAYDRSPREPWDKSSHVNNTRFIPGGVFVNYKYKGNKW